MWPENVAKKDVKVQYYRGSGSGGQNRNKRDSACRMTHLPTGLAATAEEHKTQHQNWKAAWKRLSDKLVPLMKAAANGEARTPCTDVVRTYHEPRQQVKDHRIKGKTWSYKDVLNGKGLDSIIEELRISNGQEES